MAFTGTIIGTNALNSITRRAFPDQTIVDQVYQSNALYQRWSKSGRTVKGGVHLEQVLNYKRYDTAVRYKGFDIIPPVPKDTFKNAAWDWNHIALPITIDGPTLRKNDSPDSIANIINGQLDVATMELEDVVGTDLFSNGADANTIEGLRAAVDDGSVAATYGGLGSRTTTNDFWQPATGAYDTTTTTLTLAAMGTVFQAATEGARHPTIIITTDANYNRFENLTIAQQRFPVGTSGASDEQLASAGFTNLLYRNVPLIVDSHCPANHMFFLNETFFLYVTNPDASPKLGDWLEPTNQDAFVAKLILDHALVCQNVQRQGAFTGLTS
jgi:hypothetical protein